MKIKKNLKGVTLCEVLVAMTIFAVMMLVVTTMIATTSKMNIKNHKMNKQMQTQGASVEKKEPGVVKSSNTFDFNFNGYSSSTTVNIYDEATGGDYAHYKYYFPKP